MLMLAGLLGTTALIALWDHGADDGDMPELELPDSLSNAAPEGEATIGDLLAGTDENDVLTGGEGDDTLIGGEGIDLLEGGAGDDVIFGDDDDEGDMLSGGEGNDQLHGGADDWLEGAVGEDEFILSDSANINTTIVDWSAGEDQISIYVPDLADCEVEITHDLDGSATISINGEPVGYVLDAKGLTVQDINLLQAA